MSEVKTVIFIITHFYSSFCLFSPPLYSRYTHELCISQYETAAAAILPEQQKAELKQSTLLKNEAKRIKTLILQCSSAIPCVVQNPSGAG